MVLIRSRYKKFKEAGFFTRTYTVPSSLFAFLQIIIEKWFYCWGSRYKKFKEAEFFNELTQSLRVYLLFCKYYREVVFNAFSIQKIQRGRIFHSNWHSPFEFICFLANIIEKWFLMRSRYKKFKEAEFFTRTDTVASSLFAFLQILSRSYFIVEVLDTKIQRGRIFYSNWQSHFEFIFFKISIEKCLLICSRYKKFKEAEFFYSNWQVLAFIVTSSLFAFIANIIEKCFLMRSRYKKFKEAEFFYSNWQSPFEFIFFKISIEKCLLICSRYKKFKEAEFF